ncbi:n-acetyltransferase family protein [Cardiosporidium cionae]|uniref:N-acetyltransferase family protein n=1 Tax=Cardiosporidium cionae TaxID=476202 RepID=A0ABQ7JCB1_9APIC|nr:n-acetyltransferase family protein [Cardiosporidium cionae]|eukprot:KAF8821661.1 n-acetyltransferase family protein [Cardiosporidium cionae]
MNLRPMTLSDLLRFNTVNLDIYTETYSIAMYLNYLIRWPNLCLSAEAPDTTFGGYVIGKVEGEGVDWHGHVTALSVAPQYRSTGIAGQLMHALETTCEETLGCFFVDLFVRESNVAALKFYKRLGYDIWRTLKRYYVDGESAYEMRKPLLTKLATINLKSLKHEENRQIDGAETVNFSVGAANSLPSKDDASNEQSLVASGSIPKTNKKKKRKPKK